MLGLIYLVQKLAKIHPHNCHKSRITIYLGSCHLYAVSDIPKRFIILTIRISFKLNLDKPQLMLNCIYWIGPDQKKSPFWLLFEEDERVLLIKRDENLKIDSWLREKSSEVAFQSFKEPKVQQKIRLGTFLESRLLMWMIFEMSIGRIFILKLWCQQIFHQI